MSTTKKLAETYAVEDIPEVETFVDADTALQRFMNLHGIVFDEWIVLVEKRNDACENADKRMREICGTTGTGVSCGPFVFKHFATKIDVLKLYNILGEERFLELGGTVLQIPTPQMDKKLVAVLAAQNVLSQEIQSQVINQVPNYSKPSKVGLP